MQVILSIDASSDPAEAVVSEVTGRTVKVIERVTHRLGDLFSRAVLSLEPKAPEAPAPEEAPPGSTETPTAGAPATTVAETAPQPAPPPSPLGELLSQIKTPWTNAILIVPAHDYLSLNLTLPFKDSKSIERIVDLEVQDVVPFDVTEFALQHSPLATKNGSGHDVHIGLMPKRILRNIIATCKQSGFEPLIVSPQSGVLGGLYYIAPDYFAKNSAVVFANDNGCCITFAIDGSPSADRVIFEGEGSLVSEDARKHALRELKLTAAAFEKHHNITLDKVYMLGLGFSTKDLQQAIGREVERITTKDLISGEISETDLAGLGAVFVQDREAPSILTNFRTREFSFSPQLKELIRGFRAILPLLLVTIFLAIFALLTVYIVRNSRLQDARAQMRAQIQKEIPTLDVAEGQEISLITREANTLEEQLKSLGSLSRYSPLDAFLEVSNDLPLQAGIAGITRISIKENIIRVDGRLVNFGARDNLERAFNKRKKTVYCKIDFENSASNAGNANNITFTVKAQLCE